MMHIFFITLSVYELFECTSYTWCLKYYDSRSTVTQSVTFPLVFKSPVLTNTALVYINNFFAF